MSNIEADEAFARRLQVQELGGFVAAAGAGAGAGAGAAGTSAMDNPNAQTPLMRDRVTINGTIPPGNPTVLNARMTEISTSWATVFVISMVNIPQILAGMVVLALHWTSDHTCDSGHMIRWKWWAVFSILRMIAYCIIIIYIQHDRVYLQAHNEIYMKVISLRNTIEAFALIWFVVGNMWLFGDDDNSCAHPSRSPIYNLCFSYIIIMYTQICAPCIVAILLIPVFCFCLPCFIRILARLQDPRQAMGASQNIIDSIPIVTISSDHLSNGQIPTCPICLNEMTLGESARSLRCGHLFHQQCVDEWLRVNATCPTCRKSVREDANSPDGQGGSPTAGDSASTNALPPSNMTNMTISINISGSGTTTNNPINSAPSYALL